MWAPEPDDVCPTCRSGQVHDVVSPAGGSAGLRPQIGLEGVDEADGALPEALAQVGQRGGAVAQRPGDAGRAGDVRRGRHQVELRAASAASRPGTVFRMQLGPHRLVPAEQVVVDLHDDEAPGRELDARSRPAATSSP